MTPITSTDQLPGAIVFSDLTLGITIPGSPELALITTTKATIEPKWEKFKYEPAALVMGFVPEKQGYKITLEGLGDITMPEGYEMGVPDGSYITAFRLDHDGANRSMLPPDLLDPKYAFMFLTVDSAEFQKEPASWKATAESGCYKKPA